jgi:hypothetical protein
MQAWRICVLSASLALAGCAQPGPATTGSVGSATVPNTTAARLEHLAWNTAWAQTCGFYFDNSKLKSTFLAYEATNGTPPDQVTRLGVTYDRTQSSLRAIASAHADQCTGSRLDRIRANIARYLSGDFSPGDTV